MTSNEYYGKLNDRFDTRAQELRSRGFHYRGLDDWGISIFYRIRPARKPRALAGATVMHADDRAWRDTLESIDAEVWYAPI